MKIPAFEDLSAPSRRRFLKLAGLALAAPAVDAGVRAKVFDLLAGEAHAQSMPGGAAAPTYLIEIDLRDQWDQGHVFVAPGLATRAGLRRGDRGEACAMFAQAGELRALPNNVYLTNDSRALEPHVDTIAAIDCCEVARGAIHGHEAANPSRSPGRDYTQAAGAMAMWTRDMTANFPQGCEAYYSRTPTPATLHNYASKMASPGLRNGIAFKGISRSIATAYHFGAGLPGSELDRIRSKDSLFETFPSEVRDTNILPTAADADALQRVLARVDRRFVARRHFGPGALTSHTAQLTEARELLHSAARRVIVSLPLTPEEQMYWGADVPPHATSPGASKAHIWEQCAFAFKMVKHDLVRSVALEFDWVDTHDERPESQVRAQARQISLPLARLIQKLKDEGLYDRTLIAVYCVDGSRSPAGGSYGNEGKNTVILAGGMIRGGYYGDVRVVGDEGNGHVYAYHAPDPATGAPRADGARDNSRRLSAAALWRTVMRAARVPDALCERFPDVAGVAPLPFLLRA